MIVAKTDPPGLEGFYCPLSVPVNQVKSRNIRKLTEKLEVRAGIEPTYADVQSAASPLCHRTNGAWLYILAQPASVKRGREFTGICGCGVAAC